MNIWYLFNSLALLQEKYLNSVLFVHKEVDTFLWKEYETHINIKHRKQRWIKVDITDKSKAPKSNTACF